jgi:hypothetical protein
MEGERFYECDSDFSEFQQQTSRVSESGRPGFGHRAPAAGTGVAARAASSAANKNGAAASRFRYATSVLDGFSK